MATQVGSMKAKSKSESIQTSLRPRLKRSPKYKSMTLKRQEAKLDVTCNGDEEVTDTPNNKTRDLNENKEEVEDLESKAKLDISVSSVNSTSSLNNRSLMNKTSKWLNHLGTKLFVTPPRRKNNNSFISNTNNGSTSIANTSAVSVTDPTRITRKRSFITESPSIARSYSMTSRLRTSKSQSSSLTTLNSERSLDANAPTINVKITPNTSHTNEVITPVANTSTSSTGMHPDAYFTIDSRSLASKHCSAKNLMDKKLLHGVKQFNLDPKRGLEYLHKGGFLNRESPKEVALFLYREGRLSKKQIGAFIGAHHDFNQDVLSEFVAMHEFTHLILVQALRQFLWSFRLPGEAMQIDRIMESFAKHYCGQNPNLFDETDTCYILSFSIIMLNTALHNPNVKKRITCEQFVGQNRGINSGKDLPEDILELIYKSIKEEPFKIPDETYDDLMYTFFSPEKEGWLMKQGGSWKNWKRRWFVLSDRCLYYFQHTAENVPKGIIPLENVKVRLMEDCEGKRFLFEVYSETNATVKGCKTDSKGTVVQGHHKTYKMSASCDEDRSTWVQAIQDSIKEHPFYDIISAKKAALKRKSMRHINHHDIPSSYTEPTSCTTIVQ